MGGNVLLLLVVTQFNCTRTCIKIALWQGDGRVTSHRVSDFIDTPLPCHWTPQGRSKITYWETHLTTRHSYKLISGTHTVIPVQTFCSSHDIAVGKRRKIIYPIIYGNTNRSTSATRATSKMWIDKRTKMTSCRASSQLLSYCLGKIKLAACQSMTSFW